MKKILKNLLAIVLLVTVLTGCLSIEAKTKVIRPTLTVLELSMIPLEKYDINVNNKIVNSTYEWKSSNNKVVTVNNKNGKIQALKKGNTTITCTIKTNNKMYTLSTKVTVNDIPDFFQFPIMRHALGGLVDEETGKEYKYNNTLEALQETLNNDFGFIEVDLALTSDNKLVCSHGWSEQTYIDTGVEIDKDNPVMSYEQFMNTKIQGKYTTIDVTSIVNAMKEKKYLLFELDLRTLDSDTATKTAKAIVKAFGKDKSITDRLLVQVGSEEMYHAINDVYNFKHYQYFVHKEEAKNIDKVIKYCKENDIVSVAIKDSYITDTILKKCRDNGILVLAHTVDDVDKAQDLLNKGVSTICSNFLLPTEVQ